MSHVEGGQLDTIIVQQQHAAAVHADDGVCMAELFQAGVAAGAWFAKRIKDGTLSDGLRERYYREQFEIWINAPKHANVAESLKISTGFRYRRTMGNSMAGNDAVVYFGGFYIGDAAEPTGRRERAIYASLMDTTKGVTGTYSGLGGVLGGNAEYTWDHTDYIPTSNIIAQEPGPMRIRLVVWFVVDQQADVTDNIEWQEDGTPVIPDSALWSQRAEATCVIEID